MVTKVSGELTVMELGLTLVIAGTGYVLIVSTAGADVPPPGAPVTTVICAVVGVAMSLALRAMVRVLELTYVVIRAAPLKYTTDVGENPTPMTVKVRGWPPATTAAGLRELIAGTG